MIKQLYILTIVYWIIKIPERIFSIKQTTLEFKCLFILFYYFQSIALPITGQWIENWSKGMEKMTHCRQHSRRSLKMSSSRGRGSNLSQKKRAATLLLTRRKFNRLEKSSSLILTLASNILTLFPSINFRLLLNSLHKSYTSI